MVMKILTIKGLWLLPWCFKFYIDIWSCLWVIGSETLKIGHTRTHTHTSRRQLKITFLDVLDYSEYSDTNISNFFFSRQHSCFLPCDCLTLLQIVYMDDSLSIPKNSGHHFPGRWNGLRLFRSKNKRSSTLVQWSCKLHPTQLWFAQLSTSLNKNVLSLHGIPLSPFVREQFIRTPAKCKLIVAFLSTTFFLFGKKVQK